MKKPKSIFTVYLLLTLVLFGLVHCPFAQAASETPIEKVLDDDFEDGTVGQTPPSATSYTTGSSLLRTEISDTIKFSGTKSLMLNDSFTASTPNPVCTWIFPWIQPSQGGNLSMWIQTNNTSVDWEIRLYNTTYASPWEITTVARFQADGYITYYDGSFHNLQTYVANSWYNLTIVFKATTLDFYINGTKYADKNYWDGDCMADRLEVISRSSTPQGIIYIDDMALFGEYGSFSFHSQDASYDYFTNQDYRLGVRKNTGTVESRGLIYVYRHRMKWGAFSPDIVQKSSGLGILAQEVKKAGTSHGLALFENVVIEITALSSTTYNVTTYGNDDTFSNINTYIFSSDSPYIYWNIKREYLADLTTAYERQTMLIFNKAYETTGFYWTSDGYDGYIGDSEIVKVEYSSTSTMFMGAGYYFNWTGQDFSAGTVFSYVYETDARTAGLQQETQALSYGEIELSFGQAYSDPPVFQNIYSGTIEKAGGIIYSSDGCENITQSLRNLATSQFSNPSAYTSYDEQDFRIYSTATLHSVTSSVNSLTLSLNSTSGITSITKIYCSTFGKPSNVEGATSSIYEASTRILKATATHSSLVILEVSWTGPVGGVSRGSFLSSVRLYIYGAVILFSLIPMIVVGLWLITSVQKGEPEFSMRELVGFVFTVVFILMACMLMLIITQAFVGL